MPDGQQIGVSTVLGPRRREFWFAFVVAIMSCLFLLALPIWFVVQTTRETAEYALASVAIVFLLVLLIWALIGFRRAYGSWYLDPEGITYCSSRGKRRKLEWLTVESVRVGMSYTELRASQNLIRVPAFHSWPEGDELHLFLHECLAGRFDLAWPKMLSRAYLTIRAATLLIAVTLLGWAGLARLMPDRFTQAPWVTVQTLLWTTAGLFILGNFTAAVLRYAHERKWISAR